MFVNPFQVSVDAHGKPVSPVTALAAAATPRKERTTMQVDRAKLAQRIGLPATSSESLIRARLAGLELETHVRASATPAGRRLTASSIQAASNEELRDFGAGAVTQAEREAVNDEVAHRQLMATHFPAVRQASNGRARIHHFS